MQVSLSSVYVPDIEVSCYSYEGVDAVKSALKQGLNFTTEDMPIKVISRCHVTVVHNLKS